MTPKHPFFQRVAQKVVESMPILPSPRPYPYAAPEPLSITWSDPKDETDSAGDWPLINDHNPPEDNKNEENPEKDAVLADEQPKMLVNAFALHLPNRCGGVTIVAGPWRGSIYSIVEKMDPDFEMHFPTGTVKKNALGYDTNQNVYLLPERNPAP